MVTGHFQEFEDEYLETLYEFNERIPGERVRNGELAKYLGVSPASATEMIQRLAKNGFVDYVPYKGAVLTDKGLEHGMMMKRRHRLAEVLLTQLPFEGDVHETACRLEHAFNDDLEVCISLLLGNPTIDPSGRTIPPANQRIAHRLEPSPSVSTLSDLPSFAKAEVALIMTTSATRTSLKEVGINIGDIVENTESGYILNGQEFSISKDLGDRILMRLLE